MRPSRPPATRVVLAALPALGAAVLLCAGGLLDAATVVVLEAASLVVVVVLAAGEDTVVDVLRVEGKVDVSVMILVGTEVVAPAMAALRVER